MRDRMKKHPALRGVGEPSRVAADLPRQVNLPR